MGESLHILMLEDNPADAELAQSELQEAGFVFTAKVVMTEKDFVRELEKFSPDLILSDYDLPQYNGALALAEARRRCPDTPFILVTGAVSEDRAIEIFTQGAKDYVLKNRLQQRLAPAVRRALLEAEEHRARKKAEEDLREAHKTLERQVEERNAALRKSEHFYHSLFENMLNGFAYCKMIFDQERPQDFVYLDVNNAFESLTGLKNVVGKRVSEVIPGIRESDAELFEIYGRVALTGKPERCEKYVEAMKLWFSISVYSPEKEFFVAVFDVITERKLAEKQLLETNHRLQSLMQALPVGISFSDDATGKRITGNPAVLEQFEVGLEDNLSASAPDDRAPGRRVRFFRDGRRLSDAELPLQRAIAENRVIPPMELEVKLPNGRTWFTEATGAPVRDAEGKVIAGIAVTIDITARKQTQEKLRRYELLADRHRDVILFIGLDGGRILEANDAATRVYGYPYEQLLTLTIHDLRAADSDRLTADQIAMAFNQGLIFEIVHRRQDGSTFPVEVSAQGADIGGRRILISVVRDITERKQIERELKERTAALEERTRQMEAANKELDSFSYSVSHDLRAPLRAIDGYSRMILRQQGDTFDENTRRQFDVIRNNTTMMEQLINDLLALSRLGREALSISRLTVEDLTRDVWEELKASTPDRFVDMKIDPMPPGMGDRSLIKQVLMNILSNAIKFTRLREVPLIEVGGYVKETENVYYVRDNGVGFDMQYHDKLFGVFQRLHSVDDYEGTGVGLAIVQRIIQRHGGRVWAEGVKDKCATFYFSLPAYNESDR